MPCAEQAVSAFSPISIVGYRGKMGGMFSRSFQELGYTVYKVGRVMDESAISALRQSKVVLLSVPVTAFEEVLRKISPYLQPEQALMDVTSVKFLPWNLMEEYFSGQVIAAHPLFGPVPNKADMKVALVRGKNAEDSACRGAELLFQRMGCATFWTTAAEHDRGVAFAQSLNFTVSAAFFCALARQKGIRPFLTPSFKRHLEAARKHLTVDTNMFCEFTAQNPAFKDVLNEYQGILSEVAAGNLAKVAEESALWYAEE
jgi:prephenate dehydrogenase